MQTQNEIYTKMDTANPNYRAPTPKQAVLIAKLRSEAAQKISAATTYAGQSRAGQSRRIQNAIDNLSTVVNRDECDGANGGPALWISMVLQHIKTPWLDAPK